MTKPIIGIASDVQHIEGARDKAFTYLTYVESLRRAGAIPVLVPPQPENAADVVEGLDGLLLAGGGTLVQDIDDQVGTEIQHASRPENRARHDVLIEQGTKLASILPAAELNVNSSHHQAIRDLAEGLRITAHAPDGVIEGLEDPRHPFYVGVQWHPEDMNGERSAGTLFDAFIEAARHYSQQRRPQSVAAASE